MCKKCGMKHKTFKNGKVRKTCPQKGQGIKQDIKVSVKKIIHKIKPIRETIR